VITFVAQLDPLAGAASSSPNDLSQLTIFNTFRTCHTIATKVAAFAPDATVDETVDPDSTVLAPNSTAAANDTELPRDAFVGDYAFESETETKHTRGVGAAASQWQAHTQRSTMRTETQNLIVLLCLRPRLPCLLLCRPSPRPQ